MRFAEVLDEQRNGCIAMNDSLSRRQGDESGQALVMFVVSLAVLMGLVALVVDVGAWLGTRQRLQNMADAAALAAVQQPNVDTSSITAGTSATLTLNTSNLNAVGLPTTATATASDAAPIVFGAAVGLASFNESATATAQSLPLSAIENSDLIKVANTPPAGTPPFVAPIVVNQCVLQQACTGWFSMDTANQNLLNCTNPSVGCDLTFDDQNRTDSLFGIANISGVSAGATTFRNWMRCRPSRAAQCAPGTIFGNSSPAPLTTGTSGNAALNGMNTATGNTLILPVFSGFVGGNYNLVGFSAFVMTTPRFSGTAGSGNWQADNVQCGHAVDAPCKVIHGYFTQYNLPAFFTGAQLGGGIGDYGVRGVGLTK
jgi:Flp pilus assembly protein TadG